MKVDVFFEILALFAIPTYLVLWRLEQIRVELLRLNNREEARENECRLRRKRAVEELKRAVRELSDPEYEGMDYAFGTGHGHRRAERIVKAKSLDEIERIVFGEDVATELDEIDFREAIDERERKGSLLTNPIPQRERVKRGTS